MRRIGAAAMCLVLVLALAGCGQEGSTSSARNWVEFEAQTWILVSSTQAERQAAEHFSQLLFDRTHGTVQAQCVSLGETGCASITEALQSGAADIAWLSAEECALVDPRLDAAGLPFLYLSREEAETAMDGDGGEALGEILAENGWQCLGIGTAGFRCLSSQQPVESLADLSGLRLRVGGGEVVEDCLARWGAEVINAPWAGVYTALETGIYDAQEELLTTACAASIQKVQRFLCRWPGFYSAAYLCMDGALYHSLSPLLADIARDCGAEAAALQRQESLAAEETALSAWRQAGVKVTELSDTALAEFREAARPCWAAFSQRYPTQLVERLLPAGGQSG